MNNNNNLSISLIGLCDLAMQLYDFAINKGVDLASTVNISISAEGQADVYIISPKAKNDFNGRAPFYFPSNKS